MMGTSLDIEVEFCLATRDPNGNATSGINRVNGSSVTNYATMGIRTSGCSTGANEIEIKNLSRWPNTSYYNIWIVSEVCNGTYGGYAYYPWGVSSTVDGAVVVYNQVNYNDYTLAHELGHGLGLLHTFAGDNSNTICPPDVTCATQGDLCCDTPPHKQGDCGASNPCTVSGVWTNSRYNYMSYCWPSNSLGRFTPDQKNRMLSSFAVAPRISLLTSQGCSAPCSAPPAPVANAAANITASGFLAEWGNVPGATGYFLDLSTTSDFSSLVTGFNNLNVGNSTSLNITGLNCATTYYYRVRASGCATSINSNVINTSTSACPPIAAPDLTSSQFFNTLQVPNNNTIDVVITIRNVGTAATTAPIVFSITNYNMFSGLTLSSNPSQNVTIGIDNFSLDNSNWIFDPSQGNFTSNPGVSIAPGGSRNIGIRISRSGGANGNVTQTTTITQNTGGGEINILNNSISNSILKY